MAIGDIRVPGGAQRTSQVRTSGDQFGAGVGRAVSNLGRARGDLARGVQDIFGALEERENKAEDFDTQKRFIQQKGERDRRQAELVRDARANGTHVGMTNRIDAEIEASNRAFLETVPPRLRDQYALQLEADRNNKVNGAFALEFELGDAQFRADVDTTMSDLSSQMREGSINSESAMAEFDALVDSSDLPDIEKQSMKQAGINRFLTIEFEQELAIAARSNAPSGVADGKNPVASGLTPGQRGALNTIAADESNGAYNIRFDGSSTGATFDSFADHPRIFVRTETGELSSAAGRYMFTATTWDRVANILGLTSFSPENQDRAALYLAEEQYNAQAGNGLTFDQVINSGDPQALIHMKDVLSPTWKAFETMTDERFIELMTGQTGLSGGGTGSATAPNIWTDERYDHMSYEQKLELSNAAAKTEKTRQATLKKQQDDAYNAQLNSIYLGASLGQYSAADIDRFLLQGHIKTDTEYERAQNNVKWAEGRADGRAQTQANLSNPTYTFTANDDKALNAWIGDAGVERVQNMDEDYMRQSLMPLVQRTQRIPTDVAAILAGQMSSTNPQVQAFAMDQLVDLNGIAPHAVQNSSKFTEQQKDDLAFYSAIKPFSTVTEMQELMKRRSDPAFRQTIEMWEKEGRKLAGEIPVSDITQIFDPSIFVSEPSAPFAPRQRAALVNDYSNLYVQGYSIAGDQDQARKFADEAIQREWGPSTVGTGEARLVRNGVEKYYPTVDNSHDWIDHNAREELGFGTDARFTLVPDAQTRQEGMNGANASYMVVVEQPDGSFQAITDPESGLPRRLAFEVTQTQQALTDAKAGEANVNRRISVLQTELGTTTDPARMDAINAEMTKLVSQRDAIRQNSMAVTGSDTPLEAINTVDRQLAENRQRQNDVRMQMEAAVGLGSENSMMNVDQLQTYLDQLQEEEAALDKKARGEF